MLLNCLGDWLDTYEDIGRCRNAGSARRNDRQIMSNGHSAREAQVVAPDSCKPKSRLEYSTGVHRQQHNHDMTCV